MSNSARTAKMWSGTGFKATAKSCSVPGEPISMSGSDTIDDVLQSKISRLPAGPSGGFLQRKPKYYDSCGKDIVKVLLAT